MKLMGVWRLPVGWLRDASNLTTTPYLYYMLELVSVINIVVINYVLYLYAGVRFA